MKDGEIQKIVSRYKGGSFRQRSEAAEKLSEYGARGGKSLMGIMDSNERYIPFFRFFGIKIPVELNSQDVCDLIEAMGDTKSRRVLRYLRDARIEETDTRNHEWGYTGESYYEEAAFSADITSHDHPNAPGAIRKRIDYEKMSDTITAVDNVRDTGSDFSPYNHPWRYEVTEAMEEAIKKLESYCRPGKKRV